MQKQQLIAMVCTHKEKYYDYVYPAIAARIRIDEDYIVTAVKVARMHQNGV